MHKTLELFGNTKLKSKQFILIVVFFLFTNSILSQKLIVGYYPHWLKNNLPADKIQFDNLTHIIHSFAWPSSSGEIKSYSGLIDADLNNKVHQSNGKILLAFGGAGNSAGFGPMVIDSSSRKNFVNNVYTFLKDNNYDGIDIDWEFPQTNDEKKALTKLIKELKEKFEANDSTLLITMAVGPSNWSGQHFEYEKIIKYINWFAMMGYDISGSWSSVAGHNAPLYKNKDDWSWNDGYYYLHSTRSIPNEKLLLGMPFYGKQFNSADIYKQHNGNVQDLEYKEVVNKINSGDWEYFWDSKAGVPYLLNNERTKFITFDDTNSVKEKVEYALEKNVAGVMIWALGQDVINNSQPLLETIARTIHSISGIKNFPDKLPSIITLYNNYPNPFNPTTIIQYTINTSSHLRKGSIDKGLVTLKVYDLLGREVATLVNKKQLPGTYQIIFDASNFSSGVYYYQLKFGKFIINKKMILLR